MNSVILDMTMVDLMVKLWPILIALVAGIVWSVRTESNLNNNIKTTEHLTRSGERIKDDIVSIQRMQAEQGSDLKNITQSLQRIERKLDNPNN